MIIPVISIVYSRYFWLGDEDEIQCLYTIPEGTVLSSVDVHQVEGGSDQFDFDLNRQATAIGTVGEEIAAFMPITRTRLNSTVAFVGRAHVRYDSIVFPDPNNAIWNVADPQTIRVQFIIPFSINVIAQQGSPLRGCNLNLTLYTQVLNEQNTVIFDHNVIFNDANQLQRLPGSDTLRTELELTGIILPQPGRYWIKVSLKGTMNFHQWIRGGDVFSDGFTNLYNETVTFPNEQIDQEDTMVVVAMDLEKPEVFITSPTTDTVIVIENAVNDPTLPVLGYATDNIGVRNLEFNLSVTGSTNNINISGTPNDSVRYFSLDVLINKDSFGLHSLRVRSIQSVIFPTLYSDPRFVYIDYRRDIFAPKLQIDRPLDKQKFALLTDSVTSVTFAGTVHDEHTGIKYIGYSTDEGNNWQTLFDSSGQPGHKDESFTFVINYDDTDIFFVLVKALDYRDNETIVRHAIEIVDAEQTTNLSNLLSYQRYLKALLEFTKFNITYSPDAANKPGPDIQLLEEFYNQYFADLIKTKNNELGLQPLNKLRLALEVLYKPYFDEPTSPIISQKKDYTSFPLLAAHWVAVPEKNSFGLQEIKYKLPINEEVSKKGAIYKEEPERTCIELGGGERMMYFLENNKLAFSNHDKYNCSISLWIKSALESSNTQAEYNILKLQRKQKRSNPIVFSDFGLWLLEQDKGMVCGFGYKEDQHEFNTVIQSAIWNHISVVKEDNYVKLYVNGVLMQSITKKSSDYKEYDKALVWFGSMLDGDMPDNIFGVFEGFQGSIADIRLYNFALSEKSIKNLYSVQEPGEKKSAPDEFAYEVLLKQFGTSYETLRLIRSKPELQLELGKRLGVGNDKDQIIKLTKSDTNGSVNKILTDIFGFRELSSLFANNPLLIATPDLLQWKETVLIDKWKEEDDDSQVVIIDPDLLSNDDFVSKLGPYVVYTQRKKTLENLYKKLTQIQNSSKRANDSKRFDSMIKFIYKDELKDQNPPDIQSLWDDYIAGVNAESIDSQNYESSVLATKHLSISSLQALIRLKALAEASLTNDEWELLKHICVSIFKIGVAQNWRKIEKRSKIYLLPEKFTGKGSMPLPIPFRSNERMRYLWNDTLEGRSRQLADLRAAYQNTLLATDEIVMPYYRDHLLLSMADAYTKEQAGDLLSERFFVDFNDGGILTSNYILQAVETLQGLLSAIRLGSINANHPSRDWKVWMPNVPSLEESTFDNRWLWMENYDSWRAAMWVFLFPENYLFPSIIADIPDKDVKHFFATSFSTKIKEYLDSSIAFTEVEATLAGQNDVVKFFAYTQLAQSLQKAGMFQWALDVYLKCIIDYKNISSAESRRFSTILSGEFNKLKAPQIVFSQEWLDSNKLNPHALAWERRSGQDGYNPYTRFTLMNLAKCLIEYADGEFTKDTLPARAVARGLYFEAKKILYLPDLTTPVADNYNEFVLPNPFLNFLKEKVELQLRKIHMGFTIAGLQRTADEVELIAAAQNSIAPISSGGNPIPPSKTKLQPTPYRYTVLLERSRQLVSLAQQIENQYLSLLERLDTETEKMLANGYSIKLAEAGLGLQSLRLDQAKINTELSRRQQRRSIVQRDFYKNWIDAGFNDWEKSLIDGYRQEAKLRISLNEQQNASNLFSGFASFLGGIAGVFTGNPSGLFSAFGNLASSIGAFSTSEMTNSLYNLSANQQINALKASHERRKQEWEMGKALAEQDILIGDQLIELAKMGEGIATQEVAIAHIQIEQAKAISDFLTKKFTNAELYEWMSGVIGEIYAYFLQQATSMALLAQNQLAFERQQYPPEIIKNNYWAFPGEPNSGNQNRRGLTGSARLLQDINELDVFAFSNDSRRLNLSQTFSLAALFPYEFQKFRESGEISFAFPISFFDSMLPGHYLRLIRQIRTSIIALIPPTQGIRAMLLSNGRSKVIVRSDIGFEEKIIRRDMEWVALTSAIGANGVFEMDLQSEMLRPFESQGIDVQWYLSLPKAANPFDYRTIGDILFTIDYTALFNMDYKNIITKSISNKILSERSISFRQQLSDAWYDLNNAELSPKPYLISFNLTSADFPVHLSYLQMTHLMLYIVVKDGNEFLSKEVTITKAGISATASTVDNECLISTRRANADQWLDIVNLGTPDGEWEMDFSNMQDIFEAKVVEDILFVVSYEGQLPAWV